MPLEDAEEVGDLAVDVVDDLGLGAPVAPEEDAAHADEGLGIAVCGVRLMRSMMRPARARLPPI